MAIEAMSTSGHRPALEGPVDAKTTFQDIVRAPTTPNGSRRSGDRRREVKGEEAVQADGGHERSRSPERLETLQKSPTNAANDKHLHARPRVPAPQAQTGALRFVGNRKCLTPPAVRRHRSLHRKSAMNLFSCARHAAITPVTRQ